MFSVLKKPNLDPALCQNYRLISNLSFFSETLERLVSLQILPYCEPSALLSILTNLVLKPTTVLKLLSFLILFQQLTNPNSSCSFLCFGCFWYGRLSHLTRAPWNSCRNSGLLPTFLTILKPLCQVSQGHLVSQSFWASPGLCPRSIAVYSLKFDYLLSGTNSMPVLDSPLALPVSHTSPLLWRHNFIGFASLPALHLKFSLFSSLNLVLFLNTSQITGLLSLHALRSSNRRDLFLPRVRTTMAQSRPFASTGPSLWNCLPSPLRSSFLSLPISSSLSSYFFLELRSTEALFGVCCERRYMGRAIIRSVSGHSPPDISPRTFPPDEKLYINWTKYHKSNFYLRTELFPSIPLPCQQRKFFIKCKGRLDRFLC